MNTIIKNGIYKCTVHKYHFYYFYIVVSQILDFSVVLDNAGYSKGYGFIRFGNEEEQKHCLNNMNGFPGLGSKPIKVSSVLPKSEHHIV